MKCTLYNCFDGFFIHLSPTNTNITYADCSIRNGNCGKFDCMEAQVNGVWMGECVCEKGYTRRHYLSLCVG